MATVTIDIAANHVPEADSQAVSLNEDTPQAITLTGSDVDLDPLTFQIVRQPQHGTLSGTAPNLVYTPVANYYGSDSFAFIVNDGTDNSPEATVSITVNPVNDAPVANNQSLTTDEDTPLGITLSGSDIELDPLTFQIVNGPSHGTLSGTAPNLVYTPSSNYNGSDSFTFVAHDGVANSLPATISLVVNPVNDAPVAVDDAASTPQDTPVLISLLENDSDVDGPALSIQSLSTPAHGTLVNHGDGTVTYTPAAGYIGPDTFNYVVTDGEFSDSATVTVDVQASQVTLTFSNNSQTTIRDWSTTTSTISVPTAMDNPGRERAAEYQPLARSRSGHLSAEPGWNPRGAVHGRRRQWRQFFRDGAGRSGEHEHHVRLSAVCRHLPARRIAGRLQRQECRGDLDAGDHGRSISL